MGYNLFGLKVKNGKRGSVLLASIILIVGAGLALVSWLGYVNSSYRSSSRDWGRMNAFYAAESGVERAVDFFNNPNDFPSTYTPTNYTAQSTQPPQYMSLPTIEDDNEVSLYGSDYEYGIFEPYIISWALNTDGSPLIDEGDEAISGDEDLVITRWTYFQDLAAGDNPQVSKTSKIPTFTLTINDQDFPELIIEDPKTHELARVTEIDFKHPIDIELEEGSLPTDFLVITKVIAKGVSPNGVEVRIESLLSENMAYDIAMPGAIVSKATAEFDGNFNIFWGELWTKRDIWIDNVDLGKSPTYILDNQGEIDFSSGNPNNDPWFRLKTEGLIRSANGEEYADGSVSGGFSATQIPIAAGDRYYTPFLETELHVDNEKKFTGRENILQNQVLPFPVFDYDHWKTLCMSYGFGYYFTDQNGNIYGVDHDESSPNYGQTVTKDFDAWFHCDPSDPDYDSIEEKLVFIDSVPTNDAGEPAPLVGGVPLVNNEYHPRNPDDPACMMSTISTSGNSVHTRGALFIVANLTRGGQGNPPSPDELPYFIMPNFETPPSNLKSVPIAHNGLFYSWGQVDFGGNVAVYGCVFAENGFSAGGTPTVYYNVRMRDGSWMNLNVSRVNRTLWNISDNL